MVQAVTLNCSPPTLTQDKPCYIELFERIVAIWNRFCIWLCEWICPPASLPQDTLATKSPNSFCHMIRYLEPQEAASCEAVCKSWKTDKIWQAQCANYDTLTPPPSGRFKDLFAQVPKMAFGPLEWKKYFGKIGPLPPLPVDIKTQMAQFENTHILTLIPSTVNGKPLNFHSLFSLAEKYKLHHTFKDFRYGETAWYIIAKETVEKSLWVWMQKGVAEESRGMTLEQAEQAYPQKIGRSLYYTISITAHFARHKSCDFQFPNCTLTSDKQQTCVIRVGNFTPNYLCIIGWPVTKSHKDIGVACLFPA